MLTCDRKVQSEIEKAALEQLGDLLERLTATPSVSFGFEVEGIFRMPYTTDDHPEKFTAVKAFFQGDQSDAVYDSLQSRFDEPEYQKTLDVATNCFHQATGKRFAQWRF